MYKINENWELSFERDYYVLRQFKIDKREIIKKNGEEIKNDRFNQRYQYAEYYPTAWSRIITFLIDEKVKRSDLSEIQEVMDRINELQIDQKTENLIRDLRKQLVEEKAVSNRLALVIKELEKDK